jgi:hypothetical protein
MGGRLSSPRCLCAIEETPPSRPSRRVLHKPRAHVDGRAYLPRVTCVRSQRASVSLAASGRGSGGFHAAPIRAGASRTDDQRLGS